MKTYAATGDHAQINAMTLHVMSGTQTQWIALFAGFWCDSA